MRSLALRPAVLAAVAMSVLLAGCSGGDDPSADGPDQVPLTVDPDVRARLLPQLADPGEDARDADDASWVVEVVAGKEAAGTPVELEANGKDGWSVVDTAELDGRGRADLLSPASGELRVVTDREAETGTEVMDTADVAGPDLSDEFDSLDEDLWASRLQGYAGVRMCSKADDSAVEASDGVLQLSVIDDPDAGKCRLGRRAYDYRLNGHIGTQGLYEFRYGYAAARVKFQSARGQHGAFWLQTPSPGAGSPKEAGGEIDVIEYFGDGTKTGGLTQWAYWHQGKKVRKSGGFIEDHEEFGEDWSNRFHVFSVEWTPDEYVFRIDGKVSFRTDKGVSGVPQFLVLSLLSSDYELKHMSDEELPQTMEVDWVRVWDAGTEVGSKADD